MTAQEIDPSLLIPEQDRARLVECKHHAPHDFYGWHATANGSVVRTRWLGAQDVALLVHNDEVQMLHTGDDPFDAQLQLSQLKWVASSEAGAMGLAENYAGLPIGF